MQTCYTKRVSQEMAKQHPGFVRRGNVWHLRKRVSDDVLPIIGCSEIHVSLKTGDRKTAGEAVRPVAAGIERQFSEARKPNPNA